MRRSETFPLMSVQGQNPKLLHCNSNSRFTSVSGHNCDIGQMILRDAAAAQSAELLDRQIGTARSFSSIEYIHPEQQALMRADRSPLTIACEDPVFRAQGHRTDRLGDAIAFFNLSQGEAHYLLCDCHYARCAVDAGRIAKRVRSVARRPTSRNMDQSTASRNLLTTLWR